MAISYCYWHLIVKNGNFTLLLTSSGQEWQFGIGYWHLVVKNGNFTLLLTSKWSRMVTSHGYWHLMVKNGNHIYWHLVVKNDNFTCLLTSSGHGEWQFHSFMPPPPIYWHLRLPLVKNGNCTLMLTSSAIKNATAIDVTSSGQEWQFQDDATSHVSHYGQWMAMITYHMY